MRRRMERLDRMLRVTQRLRKISEGLVDFARVRKQETEAVAAAALIDESWNLVRSMKRPRRSRFKTSARERTP